MRALPRRTSDIPCPRPGPLDAVIAQLCPDPAAESDVDPRQERLAATLELVPDLEARIVRLVCAGKTQRDIATIMGITQPAVHYGYHRAVARMRFFAMRPAVELDDAEIRMIDAGVSRRVAAILAAYMRTPCMSTASRVTGERYSMVRSAVERGAKILDGAGLESYARLVSYLRASGLVSVPQRRMDCKRTMERV